jgi:hypothetical protein
MTPRTPLPQGSPTDDEHDIARTWLIAVEINPDRPQGGEFSLASLLAGCREAQAERARSILVGLMTAPRMYAESRGALLMRVATVCELVVPGFEPRAFYEKHVARATEAPGDMRARLVEDFADDWARSVVREALGLLPKKKSAP